MTPQEPTAFGAHLKALRRANGLTLRQVEEASDGCVRNGYLSQVEYGQINLVSPGILWELAEVYGVAYADLLERAGHRVPTDAVARKDQALAGVPLRAIAELDEEDRETLLEYLAFLKQRKRT